MRLYAEQINQIEKTVEPVVDYINVLDENSLLKWVNSSLAWRIFGHFAVMIVFGLVVGKDAETGEKIMNVAPETEKFWGYFFLADWLTIPIDIFFGTIINGAKQGNTVALAENGYVQAGAFGSLTIAFFGTLFGLVFNLVWQLVLWLHDIQGIDIQTVNLFELMSISWSNFFDNIFYEGFKPAIFFLPFYTMLSMTVPYGLYIWNVTD